ncbi:class I SAM-dependent methyltransferase [Paractinoplanes maris]|uniref:class I SAM-dependent methyltransferase n=1 Tax=Paractinoplanes maris TaxID=1734446 RepID=UPI00202036FD|nr:class I SAM-dependent methyltransferase [Actinoplanes maris]
MTGFDEVNIATWDARAAVHAASPQYAVDRFGGDPSYISDVVAFDRPLLGDVSGQSGVHLQCHIGTDTISLSRLGAEMTGLDYSVASLEQARELSTAARAEVTFVHADVYGAVEALGGARFDFVYTGIGALCWLPRIDQWVRVVRRLLRPGGRLFLREGHPMLWALAPARPDGLLVVDAPYFEMEQPTHWEGSVSYVDSEVALAHTDTHTWNHGLGEIFSALLANGFTITRFVEHGSIPWDDKPGQMMPIGGGEWRLIDRPERLPHSYTLEALLR